MFMLINLSPVAYRTIANKRALIDIPLKYFGHRDILRRKCYCSVMFYRILFRLKIQMKKKQHQMMKSQQLNGCLINLILCNMPFLQRNRKAFAKKMNRK